MAKMAKKKTNTLGNAKTLPTSTPKPSSIGHLTWILIAGLWLLAAAALLSHDPADWPSHTITPHNAQPANWVGWVGAAMSYHAYLMLGPGVWLLMTSLIVALVTTACKKKITQPILRIIGTVMMAICTSALSALFIPSGFMRFFHDRVMEANPEGTGGFIAIFINTELVERFNILGTSLILVVCFWLGALLAVDHIVLAVPRFIGKLIAAIVNIPIPKPVLVGRFPNLSRFKSSRETSPLPHEQKSRKTTLKTAVISETLDEDEGCIEGVATAIATEDKTAIEIKSKEANEQDQLQDTKQDSVQDNNESVIDAPAAYLAEKKLEGKSLREKFNKVPVNFAPRSSSKQMPLVHEVDLSGYRFPDVAMLDDSESSYTKEVEKNIRENAAILEASLQQYHIDAEVVGIDSGPVITLYEIRLSPGTKVASLGRISSDLARALKSQNIRIVANTAGKDTVGIEVPNQVKEKVRLKELMTGDPDKIRKMNLPMFLGKDASGNHLIQDLATMPHMLIAGTTGSGKSVCMNTIIMSWLYTKRPDELKLVLVDPKMVEMSQFKDIPHLMCPVVTDMNKAAAILEWAVTKMDERYELLAEVGVRDMTSYNNLGWDEIKERMNPATEQEEARIPKKLPYLVFIIDELADLMMTNKEVESFIVRIAQKARAVGIHLILATQRPQANVVTGLIKSNMPCRVSFKVASGMDSRIVLDQKGAELLLGYGDMMFISPRSSEIIRAQGTLVAESEIRQTVKMVKSIAQPQFEPQLIQLKAPGTNNAETGDRDELFEKAVRVVLETQRGSVSLLQRRLTIGYSRASRLVEQIADAGIIGTYKGSQAREVNMTLDEWEALQAQAQNDASEQDEDLNDNEVPDEMDNEYQQ